MSNEPPVTLAPPGAGIPLYQRVAAKWVVIPYWRKSVPWGRVAERLRQQADEFDEIVKVADRRAPDALTRRVLIPPATGLEDDSRFWSLAMVADHLARVNLGVADVLTVLTAATTAGAPLREVRIVDYKPDPGADRAALGAMRRSIDAVERALREGKANQRTSATHPHPWFGPLPARTWAVFPAMHQSLHLAQARAIASRL